MYKAKESRNELYKKESWWGERVAIEKPKVKKKSNPHLAGGKGYENINVWP